MRGGGQRRFKLAFTLAEVLITLGIIGIVAAMTLPALIKNYQGYILQNQLKKAYSIIQSAVNKMNYDEGVNASYSVYSRNTLMPVLKKYFNIAKDCADAKCEIKFGVDDDGNQTVNDSYHYKTYNGKKMKNYYLDDGQIILYDSMFIMLEDSNTGLLMISVDVNGYNKKPNRWGQDLFTFQFLNNGKLMPAGAPSSSFSQANSYCSLTSENQNNGIGCAYYALTEKDYFKNLPK